MEPTLDIGDFILVNKFAYGLRLPVLGTKVMENDLPRRGDVMVFIPPNDKRYFIKRVIGTPGDVIEYRNKVLTINGKEQTMLAVQDAPMDFQQRDLFIEELNGVKHKTFNMPARFAMDFKVEVKPGHYFMVGDNRDNSSDSRHWGQVPEDHIVGKAFAIWMHWKDWGSIPSFDRVGKIQ
jgi:signal peptidase I